MSQTWSAVCSLKREVFVMKCLPTNNSFYISSHKILRCFLFSEKLPQLLFFFVLTGENNNSFSHCLDMSADWNFRLLFLFDGCCLVTIFTTRPPSVWDRDKSVWAEAHRQAGRDWGLKDGAALQWWSLGLHTAGQSSLPGLGICVAPAGRQVTVLSSLTTVTLTHRVCQSVLKLVKTVKVMSLRLLRLDVKSKTQKHDGKWHFQQT